MSNALERNADDAMKEYIEAVEEYNQLLDKYFPVSRIIPGVEIKTGEPVNEKVLGNLEEAEGRVTKARLKWDQALRKLL
jgi:hypothetical protein